MKLPEIQLDDRRFQDLVSEARLRINRVVPGVDRAQRLRSRHHADRAVRLDDGDDDLPAQPRAGQAPREAARAARHPARRPERRGRRRALPARRAADRAGHDHRRRDRGRARRAPPTRSRSSSRSTTTSRSRRARPAAYVLQRGGQIKDVGVADGEARPQGADQMPFGNPPRRRRRALPRLRRAARAAAGPGRRRRLAGPRRGRQPRGPAAALGGLPGRRPAGRRRSSSRTSPAASTTAPARSSSSSRRGRRCSRSAATACTGCAAGIDDKTRHGGAATTYTQAPEIYSITAAPVGALLPASHAAQEEHEMLGVSDGTPGPGLPAALQPRAQAARPARRSRCATPSRATGRRGSCAPDFVASTEFDRHFTLDPVGGEIELGPAIRETDGGWTQYGAIPPKGAVLRFTRYRHGGGRAGNVAAGALNVLRTPIARRRHGHQPGRRRAAASTPSRSSTRASARRWRSAPATARSPPRTSSSSPARRRRGSRARSACRRDHRRAGRSCTSSRALPRRPPARLRRAACPTRR